MNKHVDRKEPRLPAGVTKIDAATGGAVTRGAPWCYRAAVMVAGARKRQRFPASTPIGEISEWLDEQRGTLRKARQSVVVLAKGTFESDVENEYLPQVRHLAAYTERRIDIERWAQVFKSRNRNTIKASEIRKHMSAWAAGIGTDRIDRHGRTIKGRKLSPSTLNHRLSALSNFYELLNGKRGYNPVAEIERFREGDRPIRALVFDDVRRIVAELPDNVTGARLRCLAYTGMRPVQLKRLSRKDIEIRADSDGNIYGTVWIPVGKSGRTELINLPEPGVAAFQALIRFADDGSLHARFRHKWGGTIALESMRDALRRAAKRAGYQGEITTYQLRHSFATHMLDMGASTRQVQQQLTHSSLELIERYTKVQNSQGLRDVMRRIG
jgi:integrase/recombinase XerD